MKKGIQTQSPGAQRISRETNMIIIMQKCYSHSSFIDLVQHILELSIPLKTLQVRSWSISHL